MHSTSDPKQADPDGDVLLASVNEELEKAIARGGLNRYRACRNRFPN